MLIGPVFAREAAIAPRRIKIYVARTTYALALLVLMSTAWLVLTGTQLVRDVGDLARFGTALFQILAPLQLALAAFFSALLAASEVAHEKDRRTLILLLLTNLSNGELVLGKLLASLLNVLVMLAAALPVFLFTAMLGGVSYGQIARAFAVTLATVLVCGSLGSTLALWREKTFQALAMTVLVAGVVAGGGRNRRGAAAGARVWRAALPGAGRRDKSLAGDSRSDSALRARPAGARTVGHAGQSVPGDGRGSRTVVGRRGRGDGAGVESVEGRGEAREERREGRGEEETESTAPGVGAAVQLPHQQHSLSHQHRSSVLSPLPSPLSPSATRRVWDNPVIWREIRTWAYGRKILVVRLAYLAIFALAAAGLYLMASGGASALQAQGVLVLAPLLLLSLVLVNAQAVTSLTSERDVRALDLLLVTDLTPQEIVFGKLGGVFYNTKEMVLLPMLLCAGFGWPERWVSRTCFSCWAVWPCLYVFAATLGLHAGMSYANSGAAIATSLGTVFFLFLGVAVCMRIMMAFSGSFQRAVSAVLRLHGVRRRRALRGARAAQSVDGHRRGVVCSVPSPRSTRSPAT